MAKVKQICEEKIGPIIEEMGYELLEVEYVKENGGMSLIFTIDKEGGVTIDDCEIVNRKIDPIIDELNPTDDKPYTLVVSSPGLDRPIKTERDFKRNLEKEVEVKFYEPLKPYNKKLLTGMLKAWDETSVTILIGPEEQNVKIPRKIIAQIVPVINF